MKKIMFATSCMLVLFMVSCTKEETTEQPVPNVSKTSCDFNGSVNDPVALCNVLNYVANCSMMDCGSGNFVTTTLMSSYLVDVNNNPFTFLMSATVTQPKQIEILQAGQAYANANIPAGYFISYINFQYTIVVPIPNPSVYLIYVTVTYKKCTGGGNPQG